MTCIHFSENMVEESFTQHDKDTKTLEFMTAWCGHPLSQEQTSEDMIFNGPCGRDLKLWETKYGKQDNEGS